MLKIMTHSTLGNLVWLGGTQLSKMMVEGALRPESVVVINADKSLVTELKKQALSIEKSVDFLDKPIEVIHAYLAEKEIETDFYEYNLSEYSALSKISGLSQLFPGIKLEQKHSVSTTSISSFIQGLSLDKNNTNTLWIDIIDQALPLLESLEKEGLLHYFQSIKVQTGLIPLYDSAFSKDDVTDFLSTNGYETTQEDLSDPDLPIITFKLNALWQPLKQAEERQKQLIEKYEAKEAELLKVRHDQEAQIKQAEQQQIQLIEKSEAKEAELLKVRNDQNIQIKQAEQQQKQFIGKYEAKEAELLKVCNDQGAQIKELSENLEKTKLNAEEIFQEKDSKLVELEEKIKGKETHIAELSNGFESVRLNFEKTVQEKNIVIEELGRELKDIKAEKDKKILEQSVELCVCVCVCVWTMCVETMK